MQQFSRFLMPVFLGLVISVVMMAVLLILLRLIPTIMIWIIIGALHGLLVAGMSSTDQLINDLITDNRSIFTRAPSSRSHAPSISTSFPLCMSTDTFWPHTFLAIASAAIIGFVEYGKPAGDTADKGVAGLIIGIMMAILLTISVAVLFFTRRRISLAIALIKESNR